MKPVYYKMFNVPDKTAWYIVSYSIYAYAMNTVTDSIEQKVPPIRNRVDEQLYSCIEKHFMI